jgi:hypothetical protein
MLGPGLPDFSWPKHAKMGKNWDFWFENKPSGYPGWGRIDFGETMISCCLQACHQTEQNVKSN